MLIKKGMFLLVLLCSIGVINAQEIKWMSYNEAVELQKKEPKKMMMDVYTNWCGPCKMLDKNTFGNKDVIDYVNANYYAVKFNAEGDESILFNDVTLGNPHFDPAKTNKRNSVHEFTRKLGVNAYPTIVFFDENGALLAPIRGYQKPQQLELYLKLFKEDKHKEIKTQEEFTSYYESFVPEFVP
ncbi:thioredoxin family protein [Formosa haliotis]|uniref:thioredoxin family protein n=1 Tax=Formosa haliotis TaxID=1555194 RepID=UPI000ABAC3DF|nr:thioredoxin fold domain-containing protein [Formosa haliotis]